jgi:hypothetical protein
VGSTYSFGLPDERACTPRIEADPWIADVGDRFAPGLASNRRCSISTIEAAIEIVNGKNAHAITIRKNIFDRVEIAHVIARRRHAVIRSDNENYVVAPCSIIRLHNLRVST